MGLDITARIRSKENLDVELQYIDENWLLVENGAIEMKEYIANYPKIEKIEIDPDQYSIRNFWGLRKFMDNEMFLAVGEDRMAFALTLAEVQLLKLAARARVIPNIDMYSYEAKCEQVAEICEIAQKSMKYSDMLEFVFCA